MKSHKVWRFALAAGLLTGGAIASTESLALALADFQPELAIKLNSQQSDALSNLASRSLSEVSGDSDNGQVAARRAIGIDPFDVQAAAHLGLLMQLENEPEGAAGVMNYAQRISRRDATTHFWWIEFWSQRGNVAKVLSHYDTALRTSSQAPSTLFPILVAAVENPIVSRQLALTLDNDAVWTDQFVQQFVQSTRSNAAISRFFLNLAATDFIVSERAISTAISRLIESGTPAQAHELYSVFYPDMASLRIRNPAFAAPLHLPTAFDWNLTEADFYVGLGEDGFEIDAPPSATGPIASQIIQLSPGEWQILLPHDGGLDGSERLSVSLTCVPGSVSLQPVSKEEARGFVSSVQIPANCDHQKLTISLRSSDGSDAFKIGRVAVRER